MALTTQDLRGLFTQGVLATFKQRVQPTLMLQSMFTPKMSNTSSVSIEVQRGSVTIAADIIRGADGNLNESSRSSQRLYEPFQYDEYSDITNTDVYKQMIVSNGQISESQMIDFIEETADNMVQNKNRIVRAIEKQCAEVLVDGIVVSASGDNIDYKRKAGSLLDLTSGSYWADAVDPLTQIAGWCDWIRENGLVVGTEFDMIMGSEALPALRNNAIFKANANILAYQYGTNLTQPLMNTSGGISVGYIIAGNYKINLFTYPQFYQVNATSSKVQYINTKKVVLTPTQGKNYILAYGAVPMDFNNGSLNLPLPTKGDFHIYQAKSPNGKAYYNGVRSAPLAVPVEIDTVFTAKVVAG